jgi:hypothetical protein
MYYFSCSGESIVDATKSAQGHVTPNLDFFQPVRSAGHVVRSGVFGA